MAELSAAGSTVQSELDAQEQETHGVTAGHLWLGLLLVLMTLPLASAGVQTSMQLLGAGVACDLPTLRQSARQLAERMRQQPPGRGTLKQAFDIGRLRGLRSSPNAKVVIGQDKDWLYFLSPEIGLPTYTHSRPFSAAEVEHWRRLITQRVEFFRQRGVSYVMVMTPSKSSIWPQHIPGRIKRAAAPGRFDQILGALSPAVREHVVDLRPALREQAKREQNYYRLDSHWNDRGAYHAYTELLPRLRDALQQTGSLPGDWATPVEVVGQWVEEPERHDLAAMLNQPAFLSEGTLRLRPTTGPTPTKELLPMTALTRLRDDQLPRSSKFYPYVLSQSGADAAELPKCVAFRDSFFHMLEPFLAKHCRRTTLLKHPDKPGVPALELDVPYLAEERPRLVIEQFVERLLTRPHNLPPRLLGAEEVAAFPALPVQPAGSGSLAHRVE